MLVHGDELVLVSNRDASSAQRDSVAIYRMVGDDGSSLNRTSVSPLPGCSYPRSMQVVAADNGESLVLVVGCQLDSTIKASLLPFFPVSLRGDAFVETTHPCCVPCVHHM